MPEETLAGALLALLTAFCWALTSVLLRRVKDAVKPFQSAFISSVIGVLAVLGLAAALRELPNLFNIGLTSVIYCVMAGLTNFALGRFLWYSGISTIGASRSNSIVALETLFAPLLAMLLLKEEVKEIAIWAILAILIGVILISKSQSVYDETIRLRRFYLGILVSVGAALAFSFGALLTKLAVVSVGSTILAFIIGSATSTAALTPALKGLGVGYGRSEWLYLIAAGLAQAVASISYWSALKLATVVVVTPLTQAYPLFTLILSYAYIRKLENLDIKVTIGALLITVGVVSLTLT